MHIANVEALKAWLTKTMSPICDADPFTLAKYVLALIKKDRPEPELRHVCLAELEAFLLNKTEEFVDLLFTTLKDGSYDQSKPNDLPQTLSTVTSSSGKPDVPKPRSPERQLAGMSASAKAPARSTTTTVASSMKSDRREFSRAADRRSKSRERRSKSRDHKLSNQSSRSHRTLSRDEEDHRSRITKTYSSQNRNRSRSRSGERSRDRRIPVSRRLGYRSSGDLRNRVNSIRSRGDRRSRDSRPYRRRSRSRSWRSRSRTRSRSRVKSPPSKMRSQIRTYSRSKSGTKSKSRSHSPLPNPSSPIAAWSPKRASRSRSSEGRDEKAYRITMPLDLVMSNPPVTIGERAAPPLSAAKLPQLPPPKTRCRDYDEQGLCLLGNLCPYDHGVDPVIVEDVNLPVPASIMAYPGGQSTAIPSHTTVTRSLPPMPPVILTGPQLPLVAPPGIPLVAAGAPVIQPLHPAPNLDLRHASVLLDSKYQSNLDSTAIMKTDPMKSSISVPAHNIIPVHPKDSADGKRVVIPARREVNMTHSNDTQPIYSGVTDTRDMRYIMKHATLPGRQDILTERETSFARKHVFDPSRLGIRKPPTAEGNATLELAGVPLHLNTISSINEELSKYGTIVNIQVCYSGLADHALVSFARNAEATAAFCSSEPVFNNRFVTVSWHSNIKQDSVPVVRKLSVKERLGNRPAQVAERPASSQEFGNNGVQEQPEKRMIVLSPSGALTKTLFNKLPTSKSSSNSEDSPTTQDLKLSSNPKDLRKEQVKVKLEIAKQKHLIMKKHLEQQKALLLMLENPSLCLEEKKSILKKIKLLEGRLEKLRADIKDSASLLQPFVKTFPGKVITNHHPPKTFQSRVEIQKSILDAELDLIAKENQGIDTSDLKKTVAVLKSQAAAQGLTGSRRGLGRGFRGHGGHRGMFSGSGRGRGTRLSLATKLIDRRPKQLMVSGFLPSDSDQILAGISKFSGVESTKVMPGGAYILITFVSRHDAEKAALDGLKYQDQKILMNWFDTRNPVMRFEEKKNNAKEALEEDEDVEEEAEGMEAVHEDVDHEDSESEVELIVEDDDDDKDEEPSVSMAIALDEDVLDESELLRLDEDDEDTNLLCED